MRVIDSCLSTLNSNKRLGNERIKLIWEKNSDLNCLFSDIFMPIDQIDEILDSRTLNYLISKRQNIKLPLKTWVRKKIHFLFTNEPLFFDDLGILKFRYQRDFWNSINQNLFIASCYDFYTPQLVNSLVFQPVKHIQKRINEQSKNFGNYTIGVHIRRTDNIKSTLKSRTDLFINEMRKIVLLRSDVDFFLATDDPVEEKLICREFGGIVHVQEQKINDRNTREGLECAMIDLYTLSRTKMIFGSFWSSFTNVSAALTNIPLLIIQ